MRDLERYLSELAYQAVRSRGNGFRLNLTYLSYEIESYERPAGFSFQDIVEHFCWISRCTYWIDKDGKPDCWLYIRLPRRLF